MERPLPAAGPGRRGSGVAGRRRRGRAGEGRAGRGRAAASGRTGQPTRACPLRPGRRRTGRPPAGTAWGSRAARSSGCCCCSWRPVRGSSSPCFPLRGGRTRSPGWKPGRGYRAGPDREGAGDGQDAFRAGLFGVAPPWGLRLRPLVPRTVTLALRSRCRVREEPPRCALPCAPTALN